MPHRLFLAIPLPPPLVSAIEKFQKAQEVDTKSVRWTHKDNLHVSVHFFGDIDDQQLGELVDCVEEIVSATPAFELIVDQLAFAPKGKPARMLWLTFIQSDEYRQFVETLRRTVKEEIGGPSDARKPSAHVTVARLRDSQSVEKITLESFRGKKFMVGVDSLILYESDLGGNVPEYTPLQTFVFGSGDEE